MKPLDPNHIFPAGSHPGGLYLPNTAGPAILDRQELEAIAEAVPPAGLFVEIGTWTGSLAAHLADARPGTVFLSVDNFDFFPQNLYLWQLNRRPNMRLFAGDSGEFFDCFGSRVRAVGVFVDGDHSEAGVYRDLRDAARILAPGSEILAHDYGCEGWPGVKVAVDRFCAETGWTINRKIGSLAVLAPPRPKPIALAGRKMRVGFLLPRLTLGGAERSTELLVEGLDPERFTITGLVLNNGAEVYQPIAAKVRQRCPITTGDAAKKVLADQSDVLIIWGLHSYGDVLHEFRGRSVFVARSHSPWQEHDCRCAAPWITDWVAISVEAAKSWPDPSRATVLHNGIDTDRCDAGRTREEVRTEWGLGEGEVAIGYVGRLADEKNPLAAVEAARVLGTPYRAVLVGHGPEADAILARARGILPDVIHRPPVEAVGEAYRALDCLVMASRYEGFGNVYAEAWYCGCPVVATPVGVIPEATVAYGRLAAVVPMNPTPADLAAAVKDATGADFRPIVDHAQAVARGHWTAEAACRRWSDYLAGFATW